MSTSLAGRFYAYSAVFFLDQKERKKKERRKKEERKNLKRKERGLRINYGKIKFFLLRFNRDFCTRRFVFFLPRKWYTEGITQGKKEKERQKESPFGVSSISGEGEKARQLIDWLSK